MVLKGWAVISVVVIKDIIFTLQGVDGCYTGEGWTCQSNFVESVGGDVNVNSQPNP